MQLTVHESLEGHCQLKCSVCYCENESIKSVQLEVCALSCYRRAYHVNTLRYVCLRQSQGKAGAKPIPGLLRLSTIFSDLLRRTR